LVQNPTFAVVIGGESSFKVLCKSTELLHEVFGRILEEKQKLLLQDHRVDEKQAVSESAPDNSLTFTEFARSVLDLRNKVEKRKEQQQNPLAAGLNTVDRILGKQQLKNKRKKGNLKHLKNDAQGHTHDDCWMCVSDPSLPDRNYYFNKATREVTWEMPEHMRYKPNAPDLFDIDPLRLSELKKLFSEYDSDGSATIDRDELFLILCALELKNRKQRVRHEKLESLNDRGRIRLLMMDLLLEENMLEEGTSILNFVQFCRIINRFEEKCIFWFVEFSYS